jgi:hypothetical protein
VGLSARPPGVELGAVGVDGATTFVEMPVNRQFLLRLPAEQGAHIPIEMRGTSLPTDLADSASPTFSSRSDSAWRIPGGHR